MSWKIGLIQPYTSTEIIKYVTFGGVIPEIKIAGVAKEPYKMQITLYPKDGELYSIFRNINKAEDQENIGLRVVHYSTTTGNKTFDIAFVKVPNSTKADASGRVFVELQSMSYLFKNAAIRPATLPDNLGYSGSASQVIGLFEDMTAKTFNQSLKFDFRLLSGDRVVNIPPNSNSAWDFFQEVIVHANWSWRESGIADDGRIIIEYGEFENLEPKFKAISPQTPNLFYPDNFALIGGIPEERLNGSAITHLLAVGSIGLDNSSDAKILLSNPNASYIRPDFPLVDLGRKQVNKNGQIVPVYYIQNGASIDTPVKTDEKTYKVPLSADSGIRSLSDAEKYTYAQGINRLRTVGFYSSYFFKDMVYKIPPLPLDGVVFDYQSNVEYMGKQFKTMEYTETNYLSNVEINLNLFE